jgi:hypothetical protein
LRNDGDQRLQASPCEQGAQAGATEGKNQAFDE